jgi:hypothetical protein
MANTYIVTNLVNMGGNITVSGTVNGIPVQVTYPNQVFASTLAFQAFIQGLMLAQAPLPTLAAYQTTWTV